MLVAVEGLFTENEYAHMSANIDDVWLWLYVTSAEIWLFMF